MVQIRTAVVLLGILAVSSPAFAGDKGIFVSPTTGVPVSSVWGVFVGVSEYQHKDLNLTYAAKDAQALHKFFVGEFAGKVPEDHFALVLDKKATRGDILGALAEVFNRAFEQDLVVISLSMHGLPDAKGSDLFFLAHDTDPNKPWDRGVSRDDILKLMGKSKARKVVMLIDACNSGGFGSAASVIAMKNVNLADVNRLLVAMGQAQDGIAIITSSSAAERSQEGEKFCGGHGAFTCALLTGLKGDADTNNNGLVELREAFDFAYRTVKESTGGVQNPHIEGRFDNGLPLAMVSATATRAKVAVSIDVPDADDRRLERADASDYEKLLQDTRKLAESKRKYREKLEETWKKVKEILSTNELDIGKRKAVANKFLTEFPEENPHAKEIEGLLTARDGEAKDVNVLTPLLKRSEDKPVVAQDIAKPGSPESSEGGKHTHDGIYLHFSSGPGIGTLSNDDVGDTSIAHLLNLQFGYSATANLELSLDLYGCYIYNADFGYDSENGWGGVGGGLSYYVMPYNLFANLSFGYARFNSSMDIGGGHGIALQAALGKEWWISDNWGIGPALHFSYARAFSERSRSASGYSGALLLSFAYN